MKTQNKRNSGITLIALVVTIIVLIILACVSINLVLGENGIIEKAKIGRDKTEEASAKERLEMELLNLQQEKILDTEYNQNEYIDNYLMQKQMVVMGDIVIVDGWQFQIDRSVPQIVASLGKGKVNDQIKLETSVSYEADYTKGKITVEIIYEGEIASIQINGENVEIPEKQDGKYVIEKEITSNGNYVIYVKDIEENFKTAIVSATEISADMDIYTVEDLVAFRDKVNKGATFAGKTITLKNDLDLSSVCGASVNGKEVSWQPIGATGTIFAGTFDGDNHTISNIYINSTLDNQGLFAKQSGTIRKLTVASENTSIRGGNIVGGIVGKNFGLIDNCISDITIIAGNYVGGITGASQNTSIVQNCYNSGNIIANSYVGGITGLSEKNTMIQNCYNTGSITGNIGAATGGICGASQWTATIKNCYNIGTIVSKGKDASSHSCAGGIVGAHTQTSTIENCYNTGNVTASYPYVGGIVGYNGNSSSGTQTVKNVYNTGTIKKGSTNATGLIGASSSYVGYLIGRYGSLSGSYAHTTNSVMQSWTESDITTNLGTAFKVDANGINDGLPILSWQ